MYNRTKRKNMTRFDYLVRILFTLLLLVFIATVLYVEPYKDDLVAINNELQNEVVELKHKNDLINAENTYNNNHLQNVYIQKN